MMTTKTRPKPLGDRVLYLVPFRADGVTTSNIVLVHHAKLPTIYGRVTDVHPSCRNVRVGDWVVFPPKRPIRVAHSAGVTYALDERQVLGIVDPGDGEPWFNAK